MPLSGASRPAVIGLEAERIGKNQGLASLEGS
jgi:hypothetical protein